MSLRTELTCRSCDGSGTYYNPAPPGLGEPMPCDQCVEGIPRTLIEEGLYGLADFVELRGADGQWRVDPRKLVAAVLREVALRDREEPHE